MAEELFCKVYHHSAYSVGQDVRAGYQKNDILAHMKNAFEMDDIKCETLIKSVDSRPPPKMVLNVDIVQAENLDPNGLNDPYCILWSSSAPKNQHTTSAKMKTLNPVWRESFQMDFDGVESIMDKMIKISYVKGIWGMEKLAKEIIQTIYLGKLNNEFVGSTQISLKNIPAKGFTAWFKLHKNKKLFCNGKILLRLTFGSEYTDQVNSLKEHQYLVKIFLQHDIRQKEFNEETWNGVLSPKSEIILRQHLVHCNLNCIDDLMTRWTEFIEVHQIKPLNFDILAKCFDFLGPSRYLMLILI